MSVYLAATIGMCLFVIMWAIGYDPDVGGVVLAGCVGVGVLIHLLSGPADESS